MAVNDWKHMLENEKMKKDGTFDSTTDTEANGYMYCFCKEMWMDGILKSETRQAAIDFKFDDKND
jgi:hypothetical protein